MAGVSCHLTYAVLPLSAILPMTLLAWYLSNPSVTTKPRVRPYSSISQKFSRHTVSENRFRQITRRSLQVSIPSYSAGITDSLLNWFLFLLVQTTPHRPRTRVGRIKRKPFIDFLERWLARCCCTTTSLHRTVWLQDRKGEETHDH